MNKTLLSIVAATVALLWLAPAFAQSDKEVFGLLISRMHSADDQFEESLDKKRYAKSATREDVTEAYRRGFEYFKRGDFFRLQVYSVPGSLPQRRWGGPKTRNAARPNFTTQ